MLGAEIQLDAWRPATNQQFVTARVAEIIEACCDEWLNEWQDGPLLAPFCKCLFKNPIALISNSSVSSYIQKSVVRISDAKLIGEQAAIRLADTASYWRHLSPSAVHIFKIAMTYTARFDRKGRGVTEEQDQWGFIDLTWGGRKADIDADIRAKPWVSFAVVLKASLIYTFRFRPFLSTAANLRARHICDPHLCRSHYR